MQIKPWKFVVIAVVLLAFLGAYLGFGLTLGIDLAGGSVLIYELRHTDTARPVTADDTKAAADILQKRLDSLGLKEMELRAAGEDRIMVQLPGISPESTERIKKVIAKAGQMYLKIVYDSKGKGSLLETIRAQSNDPDAQEAIRQIQSEKAAGQYDPDESAYDTAIYQYKDKETGEVRAQYTVLLLNEREDVIDGKLLADAYPSRQLTLQPTIDFVMKPEGAGQLARLTERHQGAEMAIVLDGMIISAPNIRSKITEGRGIIEGRFTKEELGELVTVLKSGALPAKPYLESEDTIAPTLGEASIKRGMAAIYLGVLLTLVFMVVYYRAAGVIADVALIMNLAILLGVMSLFEATLTLPGIAGIVLTMGMAVDANILINERIREESARGVPVGEAVRAGYGHAFSAIIDSNITTLLTAAILYYVGTGPIRGFAVTLAVGISTSLFTALWVTRQLFELAIVRGWYTKPNYMSLLADSKIPFLQNRRPFILAAVLIANAGFLAFMSRGDAKYGIDFNGGTAIQMRFQEPLSVPEVSDRIRSYEEERAGETVRPYADVDVQRLGDVDEENRATSYQVLLSAHGREEAPPPALSPEAEDLEPDEGYESGAMAGSATMSTAQRFSRMLHERFADVLVPEAYADLEWHEGTEKQTVPAPDNPEETVETERAIRWMTLRVRFDANLAGDLTAERVAEAFEEADALARGTTVTKLEDSEPGTVSFVVRTKNLDFDTSSELVRTQVEKAIEEDKELARALSNPFPFGRAIGASVAQNLKGRGVMAILLSLMMMIVYIAFRFEFKAGLAAVTCLVHDVFAVLGCMTVFQLLGLDTRINLTTIAAFLTIVGYSINDTIVTFDRMRENLKNKRLDASSPEYQPVLNESINQVLSRTILTSVTVLIVLVILALAGVNTLEGFTLALIVGVVFGTFSSIYVATPVLLTPGRSLRIFAAVQLVFLVGAGVLLSSLAG